MTGKIFRHAFFIGFSVLLLSLILFVLALVRYGEEQTLLNLTSRADYLISGIQEDGIEHLDHLQEEDHIIWITPDGTILFTNTAETAETDLLDRPEVEEAFLTGEGKRIAHSGRIFKQDIYYARRMPDGSMLLLSEQQNISSDMLAHIAKPIAWAFLLLLLLSGLLSYHLAQQIVRPINTIDLAHPNENIIYKELRPLIRRLQQQNRTIRQQMDALSSKQQEFTAITENMSEGFLLLDRKKNILSSNLCAMQLLTGSQNEHITAIRQNETDSQLYAAVADAIAGAHAETVLQKEDSFYQLIANPVVSNGQVAGAVILIMDVTDREQRESLRREFSANVSHELKTPLTTISGFAELITEGLAPADKIQEFAGDIHRESLRLIDLINDIINLSSLDEGASSFPQENIDLKSLAAQVIAGLQPIAEERKVHIQLTGEPAYILGVRHIITEMIYNLCDNAIKYNRVNGTVTVTTRMRDSGAELVVADTGIGIPFADQSRIFERFYRVNKSHSKEIGGTGLGLSIVKHGAQYHHAKIKMESQPEKGTIFTVLFEKLPADADIPIPQR